MTPPYDGVNKTPAGMNPPGEMYQIVKLSPVRRRSQE